MDQLLAGPRHSLTYVRDPEMFDTLMPHQVSGELLTYIFPGDAFPHVVLATNRRTRRCEGVIAARERDTGQESFLLVDIGIAVPGADSTVLFRRMIALVLARLTEPLPAALAVATRSRALALAVCDAGRRIDGAACYPGAERAVIPLAQAGLAHRIARAAGLPVRFAATAAALAADRASDGAADGAADTVNDRMLVVLDLRGCDLPAILDGAGRLYRARGSRRRA